MLEHRYHGREHHKLDSSVLSRQQAPVLIDDADPTVAYVGAWDFQLWRPAFNGTMHKTDSAGTMITVKFSGTSVAVYGPVGVTATHGTPKTSYTVDSSTPVTYIAPTVTGTDPLNNVRFFSSEQLPAGDHTLVVQRVSTDTAMFFFDYLQVTPGDLTTETLNAPNSTAASPPPPPSSTAGNFDKALASSSPSSTLASSDVETAASPISPPSTLPASLPTSTLTIPPGADQMSTSGLPLSSPGTSEQSSVGLSTDMPIPSVISESAAISSKPIFMKYILAGAISGVIVLLLIVLGIIYLMRRRSHNRLAKDITPFRDDRNVPVSEIGISHPSIPSRTHPWLSVHDDITVHPHSATALMQESRVIAVHDVESTASLYSTDSPASEMPHFNTEGGQRSSVVDQFDDYPLYGKVARDTDAGISLAGGPVGVDTEETELLPPAYSSFGRSSVISSFTS